MSSRYSSFLSTPRTVTLGLAVLFVLIFSLQVSAATITVPAGGNFQAAIDSAAPGDTIVLTAGASYIGNFRLRKKSGASASSYITIITSNMSGISAEGVRVGPQNDAAMPKVLTPGNGLPAIETDAGAGFYKFIGIYISAGYGTDPTKQYGSSFLITISNGNDSNPLYGPWLSHDITFDRCHVAGKFGDSRFAFAVLGERLTVTNSVIDEFANPPGNDSAGFWFPNAGGHWLENNLISAGMWCIDMGGGDSDSPNRAKIVSATRTQATLSEMEGTPPAVGDLVAFYIRPSGGESTWTPNTSYPLGTLQFHHSAWTREVGKPPLLFYTTVGGVSGTTEPDWNSFDEYHNQTKTDGTVTWRLFNGNFQVGKVTSVSGSTITYVPEGPTGIFLPPVVGTLAKWNGYNPSVTVRRNHFLRPSYWANYNAPNKGMVQIKNAANSLFEGNFWDVEPGQSPNPDYNLNHRPGLFALTPGNQSYSAPWSTARNITFRYNRVRHIESVFNWSLEDYTKTDTPGGNNIAHDNLFEDVWHGFVVQCNGGFNVAFKHNTVINSSEQPLKLFDSKIDGLVFEDNIVGWYQGAYLEWGDLYSQNVTGTSSEAKNVFVDVNNRTGQGYSPTKYFPNSLVSMTWAAVKIQSDGRLASDSPYKGKGTNGSDPGANISMIESVMGGTVVPDPTPTPTPTPTPVSTPTPTPTPTPVATPTPTPTPTPVATPTPTPTPVATPTPTPTATPTPTPGPITVSVTSPANNSTFGVDATVTVSASATARSGSVTSVTFTANSAVIGTDTTAPYSISWSGMAAAVYQVTAVAKDSQGATVTSSPIQVKISKALKSVRTTRKNATTLESALTAAGGSSVGDQAVTGNNNFDTLVSDIQQTYLDFKTEQAMFSSAKGLEDYLFASLFLARSSASLSKLPSQNDAITDRMNKLDAYLSFCDDLMTSGAISQASLNEANQFNAKVGLALTQPSTVAPTGDLLMQDGVGMILGSSSNPFTNLIMNAPNNGHSFELGNVSVMIKGRAAEVLSVSPSNVTFKVPNDLTGGLADVIVTSRGGFISFSTANVFGLNPTIFMNSENSGAGVFLNSLNVQSPLFATVTPGQLIGLDTRTRVSFFATGISSALVSTDLGNDVLLANGQILPNLAESVKVEARTSSGAIVMLPVEYAGPQGVLSGLDQITVMLPAQLSNAGNVQLTVIIGSTRSNPVNIAVY